MSVKNIFKQSWEDLKNLELNFKNVSIVVVVTFILSNILTPLVGIPVGLLTLSLGTLNNPKKTRFKKPPFSKKGAKKIINNLRLFSFSILNPICTT